MDPKTPISLTTARRGLGAKEFAAIEAISMLGLTPDISRCTVSRSGHPVYMIARNLGMVVQHVIRLEMSKRGVRRLISGRGDVLTAISMVVISP